ncbi:hypothetical protein MPER_07241 [Moniliophthora perniciosa FA553]|nr:hypothetical protein MPER_07241 [Moniliophthora perniciosa FA553]
MGVSYGYMEAGDLSVRFMMAAIHHEIERQKDILSSNSSVPQETRGFDENRFETYTLRSKEDAPDYRYMPDPNLGVLLVNDKLCAHDYLQHMDPHGVTDASIDVLMGLDASKDIPFDGEVSFQQENAVPYFEALAQGRDPRDVVNWYIKSSISRQTMLKSSYVQDNSDFVGTAFVSESTLLTKAHIGFSDGRTHRPGRFWKDDQTVWKTAFAPRFNETFTFDVHEGNSDST